MMPPVHPAAELFPMMNDDELAALAHDIKTNGLQQPVIMFGPQLLDGRNRWKACELVGVEVHLRDWSGKDAVAFVRSLNLHRRHLSAAQRAALAVKAEPVYAEQAAQKKADGQKSGGRGNSKVNPTSKFVALEQAAKEVGAGVSAAKAMKQVAQRAPEVIEMVQRGQVATVAEAKRVAALPEAPRAEVIELVRGGTSVAEAFSVAGAVALARSERETPIGQVIAAIENVRARATSVRGACARLEDLCNRFDVSEMKSPEFTKAGIALLQARSDISHVVKKLRIKETQ